MSARHPRKKRRLDAEEVSSTTVPTEFIPLVMPHQVRKSSKDPNRGMYPTKRLSRRLNTTLDAPSTSTSPDLIKASSSKSTRKDVHEELKSEHSDSNEKVVTSKRMRKSHSTAKVKSESLSSSIPNSTVRETCSSKLRKSSGNTSVHRRFSTDTTPNATFTKASDLIKSHSNKSETSSATSDIDVEHSDSDVGQSASKKLRKSYVLMNKKPQFPGSKAVKKCSIKLRLTTVPNESCKITNYFKTSPNSVLKISHLSNSSEASTSNSGKHNNETFFEKFNRCYGLLGGPFSSEYDENRPNYFEKLPDHIMENIFCQIPILELLNCRLVCKLWDNVISNSKFMDWKMFYYRIKKNDDEASRKLRNISKDHGLQKVEDTFKVLIRFMAKDYMRKPSDDMYEVLIKNELAQTAEQVLHERFPNICTSDSKPWTILTVAILLSETVWDIYGLYKTLLFGKSNCSVHDVTNALYCVATFLLYFRNNFHINYGLCYRVYYVLYMIENTLPSKKVVGSQSLLIPKGLPGQHSLHSYCETEQSILTYEQIRILNHRFEPKQRVKIIALAGTGKTTTLIHLARLYPQVKFLNIVYNKSMCEEAKKRFPPNVTCSTIHSLAYTIEGPRLRYKLTRKIRPHDIVHVLLHRDGSSLHTYAYAKYVLDTINSYLCSSAHEISLTYVPLQGSNARNFIIQEDRQRILKDAKNLWLKMIDRDEKSVKITHDVYLKLYQRSRPNLSQFHCIMVDEAQDCNPAMIDVVLSQDMPVIFVGDPNQQIYGFRGAENALQDIDATHTYHLTKSFRFGPDIAYFASCCLETLKEITTQTLVGTNKSSSINGKAFGQYAIIARTNVMLFNEAVRLCCLKNFREYEPTTINAGVVGGLDSLGLQQMLDLCKLAGYNHEPGYVIKDKFISKFKTYEDITTYATNADDTDLLAKIELIKKYSTLLPTYIKTLKNKCGFPINLANVVFTTAHKAKGLEFDTVCLTDDYPLTKYANFGRRSSSMQSSQEEFNVFYVAATRAKKCLLFPEKMYSTLMTTTNEKFEYPVPTKNVAENVEELICISCNDAFKPHTVLSSIRREIILSSGRKIAGGVLCMKCRTSPKVRMRVDLEPVIMYSDPMADSAHLSMQSLVGPLPDDPVIVHAPHAAFQDMDIVYIINGVF